MTEENSTRRRYTTDKHDMEHYCKKEKNYKYSNSYERREKYSSRRAHKRERSSSSERNMRFDKERRSSMPDSSRSKQGQNHKNHKKQSDHNPNVSYSGDPDFTFLDYRHELNQIFFREQKLVDNVEDFWKFLSKFEAVQKKSRNTVQGSFSPSDQGTNVLENKLKLISINLTLSEQDYFDRIPPHDSDYGESALSSTRISEFRQILRLYLDFKQKEKFSKLQKLRESQANLPVAQYREKIVEAVKSERVVIIAGDTGCGKSTQVPQYLLKAGFKNIACTQPRRIACISLCKRVAYETLNEYGSEVGYQIRFERKKNLQTRILFITEGLLLRQVSSDNTLSNYDVLVLDEVHERHLHGDFLLGVVKCLLYQRPDLKLVLMSATINISLFSDYFGKLAQVIQVPGRLHPIKLQYYPLSVEDRGDRFNPGPYIRILQLIDSKYSNEERGDLLIFLSGMTEIQSVVDAAKEYNIQKKTWIVLPLHSTLSLSDQDKVFDYAPEGVRKCIVSTNIAETSITIDGIRFVADSGKVKEMSYDPVCKMQRLKEFWISKASAEQRKGRAGRTGPGVCFRLFSEEEYQAMEKYSTPELQRVPLDSLLLQMVSMGLPDARKFPFIEPPPQESIENSIISLKQQGAFTADEKLSTMGRLLARLPVDIPLGKMLVMGTLFDQVQPVLSLAAALSVQSPFTNRAFRDPECENARKSMESDHGDPITLLNAFREWLEEKNHGRGREREQGRSSTKTWCRRRGLEEQRFYEITKLRAQFKDLLQDCGLLKHLEKPNDQMSSNARAMRHGELKLLRTMRREYQNAAPRKRTLLKVDPFEVCGEADEDQGEVDIKDVEFRMRNDSNQVQDLLTGSSACSYKDLTMLKVILCSGLYPQFAIADEFNYCKSSNEQLFHTQAKPYAALHPMSFFGNNTKVLQLEESDIVFAEGFKSKLPVSSKHQLLCFMSLLETTKPYLVNTMRMPAAQTLLLFSQAIHTNSNFSRIVCDSWLQLDFPLAQAAETLLLKAASIHYLWERLLELRLEEKESLAVELDLTEKIMSFMRSEIVYTIRRLLPADLKTLYVGRSFNDMSINPNPFSEHFEATPDETLGGVKVTPRITFNCMIETEAEIQAFDETSSTPWHCDHCEMTCCLSPIERLQHLYSCKDQIKGNERDSSQNDEPLGSRKPNSKVYKCDVCKQTLYLTPIEILRHKKMHL